jgi:hypothetical protein
LFGKDLTAGTDICAEAYGRVKPEAYWANASPWLTLGQFKLGYGLTATPNGLSHNVGAGLTF